MKQSFQWLTYSLSDRSLLLTGIIPSGFLPGNDPAPATPWYLTTVAYWGYLTVAMLLAGFLAYWYWQRRRKQKAEKIQKGEKFATVKEIKSALKQVIRSTENPEIWYTRQLRHQQEAFHEKRKRKKREKKNNTDAAQSNGRLVLVNHFSKAEESIDVYNGFIRLKKFYEKQQQPGKALNMLEMAAVYKELPPRLREWALKTAGRQGICKGYWVGEAALDFANGEINQHSIVLLQNAAEKGDELSQMILNNRQYSEEMK